MRNAENRVGIAGRVALAGAVAFGAGAAMHEINSGDNATEANGTTASAAEYQPASARIIRCGDKNKWYPINPGQEVTLIASSAVAPADVKVDGRVQYDNVAETSSVVGLKSKDGSKKSWSIESDYAGSMLVQKCKTSKKQFYQALGKNIAVLERRTGLKNNIKSVNTQVIVK